MTATIITRSWRALTGVVSLAGAIALGVMVSEPARAADGDWPRWRGPNFDDHSADTGLLKEWPKEGPKLVWDAKGLGNGLSSISITDGKIFTMGEDETSSYVRALDVKDGKILWSGKVGRVGGGGGYPGPRCTPTVDGDRLYAVGQYGDLVCLQTATGAELWRKNLNKDLDGKMMSGWGNAESPIVDGDKVIVAPGGPKGTLAALNKMTGETLWRSADWTDSSAYTGAIVATLAGKKQYVLLTDASVGGVEPDTGKLLWKIARKGNTAVIPTPVVADNCVYVTSGYGDGCDLIKITATGGEFKADLVYSNKVMVNHHGGVVLVDGKIYGFSDGKGWTCQDFQTGEVVWKYKKRDSDKGAIDYADGMLYLREEKEKGGSIILIDASPKSYAEHGRFQLPEYSGKNQWPHMVIAGGKLYVRDQDHLYCYDVKGK